MSLRFELAFRTRTRETDESCRRRARVAWHRMRMGEMVVLSATEFNDAEFMEELQRLKDGGRDHGNAAGALPFDWS